jgi:hypothetical protein
VRLQAKTAALYIALSASALLLGAQAARIDFFARKVRERNNCCPAHFFAFRPVLACKDKPAMSLPCCSLFYSVWFYVLLMQCPHGMLLKLLKHSFTADTAATVGAYSRT